MRKKLCRNDMFYLNYPYDPKVARLVKQVSIGTVLVSIGTCGLIDHLLVFMIFSPVRTGKSSMPLERAP